MRLTRHKLRYLIREAIASQSATKIMIGDTPCNVEIADTDLSRSRGLMNRRDVPEGTGMLFKYPRPTQLSFWMKNTPMPLSIAFINTDGKVTEIADMHPFDETSVKSPPGCVGALEVPQGWFKRKGIGPGDHVRSF